MLNVLDVWWAGPADARPEHLALLSDTECGRRERLHRPVDRDRFTVGVALVRLVLAPLAGVPPEQLAITRSCQRCGQPDHGKPSVRGGPEFSVAHAGEHVVLAVGPTPVGVDVEARAAMTDPERLARSVLSPDERDRLGSVTGEELLAAWVRKEAVLKATGDGLAVDLTSLSVSGADEPPEVRGAAPPLPLPERFAVLDLHPDQAHRSALAVLDLPDAGVSEHDGAALLH